MAVGFLRQQREKDELIKDFKEIRKKILDLACLLSPKQRNKVFLGVWSVEDILVHLIGWDNWNFKAIKEILRGKLPSFYFYYDSDWATFNAQLVKKYKKEDFRDLLTPLRRFHRKLIDLLQAIPAEEFSKERGLLWRGYKITIAGEIRAEIDDEKIHYRQIYNWKNNNFGKS